VTDASIRAAVSMPDEMPEMLTDMTFSEA